MSNITTCTWTEKKKGIKNKECTCILSVYTFKGNKIKTVDRNEEFISEIIGTLA